MAVYILKGNYRAANKGLKNKEVKNDFEPFYEFKKGDPVEAEEYTPKKVNGVTYGKGMMLVAGAFIVPASYLEKVEGEELKALMEGLGRNVPQEDSAPIDNIVNVSDMPADKAKLFDRRIMGDKSIKIGKGAMFGGIAGFGVGYFMKKNLWLSTLIGIGAGVTATLVWDALKKNETPTTDNASEPEVSQQEVNDSLSDEV